MSGTTMIFNANANTNNTANADDGAPQVSILASASAKRMQERRRQFRLSKNAKGMGAGKKYPGVGTHHRNTKHVWLFSELAEVSAAYKEHHTTMPLWAIADMLYYSFSQQVQYNQKQQQQQQAAENDDQPIYQHQEPRVHVPNIKAIQAKLMDCDSLQHKDMLGYSSVPTQIHKQVWEHLELAKKHREMLKQQPQVQVAAVKQEQQDEQEQPQQPQQPPITKSTRKVLRHDFLYNTDAEFEATLPPAKRRKVVFEDEDENEESAPQQQQQIKQEEDPVATMSKAQIDAGIAELASLIGEVDDGRRQEYAMIQRLVIQIRDHNDQIEQLLGSMQCAQTDIEQHRQAIAHKMQQIESIIIPVPLPTPASTAPAPAPAPATMVCNKCTKIIEGELGGFSVHYADSSHPQHGTIECDECMPLSPTSRKFLENVNAEYEAMAAAAAEAKEHPEPEENYYYDDSDDDDNYYQEECYCGSNNCSIFMQQTNGGGRGDYDHSEECS